MKNTICNNFELYLRDAENIFDIMATAYKLLCPFEARISLIQDLALKDMITCFAEQYNMIKALAELKKELIAWIHNLYESEKEDIRKKLFCLVRLIDQKCVINAKVSLPDPYIQYFSLNKLFQDEIIIVPRMQSNAMNLLSETVKKESGYDFYGRNYARTEDISGYIHNFLIYQKTHYIKPQISVPNYYKQLWNEFERKNYKLVVAVFPLSNISLENMFKIEKNKVGENGVFSIKSSIEEQEKQLLKRCTNALEICRDCGVDIAVFPEMLFTERNQKEIIDYIRQNESEERRFPWFMWLGTSWTKNENKCMVIDQYGNEVFIQKKYVPYEYKIDNDQTITKMYASDGAEKVEGKKAGEKKAVVLREDLSHDTDWIVNFLDIPGFLRFSTAICRDISDDYLRAVIKEFYSNMVIIPAFSNSDRLTKRNIEPLVLEHINALVCNSCSARCEDKQKEYEIKSELVNTKHSFCYLCMVAKQLNDNALDFHHAVYTQSCLQCNECCKGFIWEIAFSECVVREGKCSANIVKLNF